MLILLDLFKVFDNEFLTKKIKTKENREKFD